MEDLGNERRSELAQENFPDLSLEISEKMQLVYPIQSCWENHQEQWVAGKMNVLGHYLSDTFVSVNFQVHGISIFSSVYSICKEESRLESLPLKLSE